MENIFKDLNDKQIEAVRATKGPVLILAGAGSGKTKALTHRIAYMISEGISPANVLAVTFTNKASNEMAQRVRNLLKTPSNSMPLMGTFHSVCARILRKEAPHVNYGHGFTIYDAGDQLSLIKTVMNDLKINIKKFNPKTILAKISSAKNLLLDPESFSNQAHEFFDKTVATAYTEYQKRLAKNNAMDFDDLIMVCVRLFRENPAILEKYQNIFRYILIDEYQDTNHAQYIWTNLLAKKHRNLFVIGDDAQSIYLWRGADIKNILNFEEDYPEAKVIKLEQNYRSTQNILNAANSVIKNNKSQKKKDLWTKNEEGEKLFLKELPEDSVEGEYIISKIKESLKMGQKLNDSTILYRTHAQSRSIEESMLKHGIPYRILGGLKFYERREVKDILAYLRLALNPNDNFSFERIFNVPQRGLGNLFLAKLKQVAGRGDLSFFETGLKGYMAGSISPGQNESFNQLILSIDSFREQAQTQNPSELVKNILKKTGYEFYLLDKTIDGEERWENVKEILTATKKFDELEKPEGLHQFLQEVALIQETDKLETNKDAVNLMTLHSVKGLEFPLVFLAGMEEGVFPHSRSIIEPAELEEERRLCYVGITRAKKQLHMTYCRQRMLYGSAQFNPPSRFLFEIPEKLLDFSPLSDGVTTEEESIFY
ncbi:MAG: ATP-dependent DNA helicase PcrA [Candidatus Yanofskybacteria bacterium CG10_big_fil_rev_8_21_14_0_10_36_16]|uniref:DNA 3'-5' helicase n=1 Tax=Candidatus Yanofskybacteria bacterium CG10_big_fil_rev_8_21_14_0_10_36_16 TaxID=1975096 RepID=A0A2J0Q6I2_9BACT|nr:MAG: ATP-dependent DNA helicase PcrA [Candidatus Yanofskybacteria bacterium CG10_big_fil_rev_8_21_14_0_10_36_16]